LLRLSIAAAAASWYSSSAKALCVHDIQQSSVISPASHALQAKRLLRTKHVASWQCSVNNNG
jgi:hypothetical protein